MRVFASWARCYAGQWNCYDSLMKLDLYTKVVLTAIMLLLGVIAFRPLVHPDTTANAQGSFAGVQFSGPGISFFDSRTGDLYEYRVDGTTISHHRLTKLGQPLVVVK